jgi:hypothetical protein
VNLLLWLTLSVASSPIVASEKDIIPRRSSVHSQEAILRDGFGEDFDFPSDQPIDLGFELEFEAAGETSLSSPFRNPQVPYIEEAIGSMGTHG